MLSQWLHEDRIVLGIEATQKEGALAEVLAHLPPSLMHGRKKSKVLDLILQREQFGTTASGEGAAFPHCRISGLEEPVILLGISKHGIDFNALDGAPVHFLCVMIFPESYSGTQKYLELLREAALIFRDRFVKERLKISESREEACEIFVREAGHLTQSVRLRHSA